MPHVAGRDTEPLGHRDGGDGNVHVGLLVDMDDAREVHEAHAFIERLVRRALAMEGTCTGEHGVGCGKMGFLDSEHGDAVDVMRMVKRSLDPMNIMNPGKVVEI